MVLIILDDNCQHLQAHASSTSFPEERGGMAFRNVEACLELYISTFNLNRLLNVLGVSDLYII